jgi:nucleoside-triphosphatase THEP1
MSIILFSRPIHSGKTTALLQYCNDRKDVQGILMPDIDGARKIMNIKTRKVFDIECKDPANTKQALTMIGKYSFYTAAFEKANAILLQALAANARLLIIDEAGKLEIDGKGFFPAIEKIVAAYDNEGTMARLLITVRDGLLHELIDLFKLEHYKVVHQAEELSWL